MADGVETERDAFAQRIHEAALGFFDVLSIRLGDRLGLYATLAEGGAATPSELADRAGIAERYAREWLEQQTAAGILRADGPDTARSGSRSPWATQRCCSTATACRT